MAFPVIDDQVPVIFTAGETVKFRRAFSDFQPPDWAYKIYFNGATNIFNKAATIDPSNAFLITLTPSDLAVAAGIYRYIERVNNSGTGEVATVGEGVVQIELDLATAAAGAHLTFWEKMFSVVEAAISGRLTSDLQSYQIAGRAVQKIPMKELLAIRGIARANVWKAANPGRISEPVLIDFVNETNDADFPATWVDVTGFPGAGQ